MGFFKNNLLKSIEWTDDSKNIMVYKYPMDGRQIVRGSKLTVRESQVAIFVNKGKIADIFSPGYHSLDASTLPILTQLLSLPYGFKSPFYADVYFINMKQFTNLKWGTGNPIVMRDNEFGTIRIRGFGAYAFRVLNPKVFLEQLFGTNSSFLTSDIEQYLRSTLVSSISDAIAESKVSALDMACNLSEFAGVVKENVGAKFNTLGLEITDFVIENISFPEQVEKAIDTRSSLGVLDDKMDTYVKYTTVNAMSDAANNPNGNNMANAGIGLGAGLAMADVVKEAASASKKAAKTSEVKEEVNPVSETTEKKKKVKYCVECGAEIGARSKFCNECGSKQSSDHVCPECGAKVSATTKFCEECGAKLK